MTRSAQAQAIIDRAKRKATTSTTPAAAPSGGRRNEPNRDRDSTAAAPTPKKLKPPRPGAIPVYFDAVSSSYYAENASGEFQRWQKDELKLLLRRMGYYTNEKHGDGLSWLEGELLRITQEQSVHYVGPLGGYHPGLYPIHTARVLVTRGPQMIQPVDDYWPTLQAFLTELLKDQAKYFCAWVKVAIDGLRNGVPWAPGQLLALAGLPGSGKSVLQGLITPMIGGRVSSPFAYLSGATNFNAEIYGAEHGLIGDVNHEITHRARRNFGASIKKLVAEHDHHVHAKGRQGLTLTPFLRLSQSLNDNPESLLVLPPMDSDVAPKIMLLKAHMVDFEKKVKKFGSFQAYHAKLVSELPAFVYHLRRWRIPESIRDTRYGVVSFHDPDLVAKVQSMSQEDQLLEVIDTHIFHAAAADHWSGNATALHAALCHEMKTDPTGRLYSSINHLGQLLTKLGETYESRVSVEKHGKNKTSYLLRRD